MVFTDEDFGRAYLTDGWATRFLKEMFTNYTVLFIGYSHNDPVMNYLSKGLPPNTQRYAFSMKSDKDKWNSYGINPIEIDSFSLLKKALSKWAKYLKMGNLDHERRIEEIFKTPPNLSTQDDLSFLEAFVNDVQKVDFVLKYLESDDWINWFINKGIFDCLFDSSCPVTPLFDKYSKFISHKLLINNPYLLLKLFINHKNKIHPSFCFEILYSLTQKDISLKNKDICILMTIAIKNANLSHWNMFFLDDLTRKLLKDNKLNLALLLFDRVTVPFDNIVLFPTFNVGDAKEASPILNIDLPISEDDLKDMWKLLSSDGLSKIYKKLLLLEEFKIIQAYHLAFEIYGQEVEFDPISFKRSSIENSSKVIYSFWDTFIDIVRDTLIWCVNNNQQYAKEVIYRWLDSDIQLLNRIGLFALADLSIVISWDKILLILNKKFLFKVFFKPEVFRVIRKTFPMLSNEQKKTLLEDIINDKSSDDKKHECDKYNLLYWIYKSEETCQLAEEYFKKQQDNYPKFIPQDISDIEDDQDQKEEIKKIEWLLNMNCHSDEEVEVFIRQYSKDKIDWDDYKIIFEVVKKSYDKGFSIASILVEKKICSPNIWVGIINGWNNSEMVKEQWFKVLELLSMQTDIFHQSGIYIASMLVNLSEKDVFKNYKDIYTKADILSDNLAEYYLNNQEKYEYLTMKGALDTAVNHPIGKITEFWLRACFLKMSKEKLFNKAIPKKYKKRFELILDKSIFGEVILTSQVYSLYVWDAEWTKDHIIPLFNPDIYQEKFQYTWDGYLVWGRWNDELLGLMLPFYEKVIPSLRSNNNEPKRLVVRFIVDICLFSINKNIHPDWLKKITGLFDDEMRCEWANRIKNKLLDLKDEEIKNQWERWIKKYLEMRNKGIPVPFSDKEKTVILEWIVSLRPVLKEAIDLLLVNQAPFIERSLIYHRIKKSKLGEEHPNEIARLLQYILPKTNNQIYCNDIEEIIRTLKSKEINKLILRDLCDKLAGLGCLNAGEILGD